ncbi:MAG: inner membrane-spanning protein YciB [bacterium]|nr:septation protein IspZ [Gammaproteobacteria bacterium]
MKQFVEFIPVAIFVAVYFGAGRDIFISTAALMAAMLLQVMFEFATTKTVAKRTLYIFGIVIVLGSLTLVFRNEAFILWKPTIVNWVFCLGLLANQLLGKDNILKKILGEQLNLPDQVWKTLTLGWSAGFFLAGALNLVVAHYFSLDFWVSYKLIGGFGLTLSYIIVTVIYLSTGGFLEDSDSSSDSVDINNPN